MKHRKKAILLVSFGTSVNIAREKTLDQLKTDFQKEFPHCTIYCAWTSLRIIQRVFERDGIHIMTVSEAMEQMHLDGIQSLLVQPIFISQGSENEQMVSKVRSYTHYFENIYIGHPLLTSSHDYSAVISALKQEFAAIPANEVLVFMEHGTGLSTIHSNSFSKYSDSSFEYSDSSSEYSAYAGFNQALAESWHSNVFAGEMKDVDFICFMKKQLSRRQTAEKRPLRIHLIPFLFTAGSHAIHDMAGEKESSWKNIFQREGYEVICHMKGLGEYPAIRKIFIDHAQQALEERYSRN